MHSTRRLSSSWIPPSEGGKSGVTRRTRRRPPDPLEADIAAPQAVEPEPEGENRPERGAVVGRAGEVVVERPGERGALDPALLAGVSGGDLVGQDRRQRAAQPVGGGDPEG